MGSFGRNQRSKKVSKALSEPFARKAVDEEVERAGEQMFIKMICYCIVLSLLECCVPVKQGAEFDNIEEDGHLSSGLIFKVGQLGES